MRHSISETPKDTSVVHNGSSYLVYVHKLLKTLNWTCNTTTKNWKPKPL